MQLSGGCRTDFCWSYPAHHAGETPSDGRVAGEQRRGREIVGSESDRRFHRLRHFQIYGSTPWRVIRDSGNEDIFYTSSKDKKTIYAIFLDWPESGSIGVMEMEYTLNKERQTPVPLFSAERPQVSARDLSHQPPREQRGQPRVRHLRCGCGGGGHPASDGARAEAKVRVGAQDRRRKMIVFTSPKLTT